MRTDELLKDILKTLQRIEQHSQPRVTYGVAEACAALGISEPSFRHHVLPHLRHFHIGGRVMIRKADLDELMAQWAALESTDKAGNGLVVDLPSRASMGGR